MKKFQKTQKKIHDDFWEKSLDLYNLIKEKGPVSRNLHDLLLSLISIVKFETVMEVGCGQGSRLYTISSKYPNAKYAGCDISAVAIEGAVKNYPSFLFEVLDIEKHYSKKRYDLVLCMDVIEHIVDDERALRNIRKMTKKYLILSTIKGRMRENEGPEGHVRNYTYNDLVKKIKNAGFEIREVIEWGFPLYSPLYRDILELNYKMHKGFSQESDGRNIVANSTPFLLKNFGEILYQVMRLNSSSKGDYIYILAEVREQ